MLGKLIYHSVNPF